MKRIILLVAALALIFSFCTCADKISKGSVVNKSKNGNAVLDIMPQKLMEKIETGDNVLVKIGSFKDEMPFVDEFVGKEGKIQLYFDKQEHTINVCVYAQNFCDLYNIEVCDKVRIKK